MLVGLPKDKKQKRLVKISFKNIGKCGGIVSKALCGYQKNIFFLSFAIVFFIFYYVFRRVLKLRGPLKKKITLVNYN